MKTIEESIAALEKWKQSNIDNNHAWWGVTQIGSGEFEGVWMEDWGKGHRFVVKTFAEALHKLCEELGL